MSRVMVIGGRGFYGARVVTLLRARGLEVVTAGRRQADVRLDLGDQATFEAMGGCEVVLNCSDSVGAAPDEAAGWCLRHGVTFLDMGAELGAVERLLGLAPASPTGAVVVGVGIFPGLSSLMMAEVLAAAPGEPASLSVRLSPLSGSGPANCRLMTRSLMTPSVWFEQGARREGGPVGPSSPVDFPDGRAGAPRIGLPDVALAHAIAPDATVETRLAVKPAFLVLNFRLLAALMGVLGPLRGLMARALEVSLMLMRVVALRRVSSAVELVASAGPLTRRLKVDDGQWATAAGAAAAVVSILERDAPLSPGVHPAGEVFDASLIDLAATLGAPHVRFEVV